MPCYSVWFLPGSFGFRRRMRQFHKSISTILPPSWEKQICIKVRVCQLEDLVLQTQSGRNFENVNFQVIKMCSSHYVLISTSCQVHFQISNMRFTLKKITVHVFSNWHLQFSIRRYTDLLKDSNPLGLEWKSPRWWKCLDKQTSVLTAK